jgi:hypothetical protein
MGTAWHLVGAPVGILKPHVLHGRQAHHPGAAAPPLAAHHAPLQSAVQLRTESKGKNLHGLVFRSEGTLIDVQARDGGPALHALHVAAVMIGGCNC